MPGAASSRSAQAAASSIAADDDRPAFGGRRGRDDAAQAGARQTGLAQRPGGARDVVEPRAGLRPIAVEVETVALAAIEPDELDPSIGHRQVGDPDLEVDRRRQHEPLVVVGVLADQVDPSGRPDDADVGPTTGRLRFALDQRVAQRLGLERRGHRIVSCPGWPSPEPRMAASRSRSGRPVWSPSSAALAAPQAFATSSASSSVAPSRLAAMNPAQNASPAPTGSTTLGSGTAGRTWAVARVGALDGQGPVGGHLDDRGRRSQGQRRAGQLGGGVRHRAAGHDGQLVMAAEQDVDLRRERPKDRRRFLVRPDPPAEVHVEADRHPGVPRQRDGALRSRPVLRARGPG